MKLLYEARIIDEESGDIITKVSSYSREGLEEEMGKSKWTSPKKLNQQNEIKNET